MLQADTLIINHVAESIIPESFTGNLLDNPIWFWISILQFTIIIRLIILRNKKTDLLTNDELNGLKESKNNSIDMSGLMNNINYSRDLYKELSKKCHPDKFLDKEVKDQADLIFQEISKHKRNYKQLLILKQRAQNELNIN